MTSSPRAPRLVVLTAVMAVLASPAAAQTAPVPVPPDRAQPGAVETLQRHQSDDIRPKPLGAELFVGGAPTYRPEILDPSYEMKPGDRVQVSLWGMVQQGYELTVDPQGHILLPGVGPIQIAGVPASRVNDLVRGAARTVYSDGVQIYAAPLASSPIQVFVTGPVARPGAYAGAATDSVITYLQRAGGVDADRGSYRRIQIVRGGVPIADVDLYDFLRDGTMSRVRLQENDSIVVRDQGPVVAVEGEARATFSFELAGPEGVGRDIIAFARPRPEATHVAVVGVRDDKPYSTYVTVAEFATLPMRDGDRVRFEEDLRAEQIVVRVEGAHDGRSVFTIARGATVAQVLQMVPLDPRADVGSIYLRRDSVRATQKQMLDESLNQLERAMYTAPSRTIGEGEARVQEADMIARFVERARQIQPDGVVTLADASGAVWLEEGDVIVVPQQSQVVTISGEVGAPQSVVHRRGAGVGDYVRLAGGYTSRADRGRVLVFRPDGGLRAGRQVLPGDRILVVAKPDSKVFQLTRDLTQIIYQIAVAAKVAVDL
ncbi:polysaccharide biosynthesis/export family protein [Caulobacter sp. 17J80-11]|uniref:polysaccharide biosynthesis/export family protein n=1 Tax=Caulobacter sp. 17J80-11 TaxID=2763502 RepID=UPI00165372C2|nr:polysaccharide biosynthesis/export family protein [Caulobacter sp. 17J80-11]MBC6981690.1 polysaccharide biosynthesis/export family protein [Caulobacter sp. 17J80-11]